MSRLKKIHYKNQPIAIDLFSGCGGVTCGLKQAGFKVLASVEIEQKARATYSLNHNSVVSLGTDIRTTDPAELLSRFDLQPEQLDLIAGCPPCQGFSRIRHRNSSQPALDPRNNLVQDFSRFVEVIRPRMVMMENVPGLSGYSGYHQFKETLICLGYNIVDCIIDVSQYNVPQRRKRLILVASLDRSPVLAPPENRVMTVRDAIALLPEPGRSGDALHDLPERRSERIKTLIQAIPQNGGSRRDLPDSSKLACHMRTNGFSDVYGRMSWDLPSPTITGGCYNPSKGRFLHPVADRAITLREAAILQGFPPDYKFDITHGREAISLMIGNALPPPFISAHARSLLASKQ
ncbi:DNA cytosine methyltransferase [Methylobacterium sp. Leaf93]|uniref:DNA cytosine methyltransferase n=1 Tax=Methylobacterium sp. Leaf93 TaxID=1736249 RepID=UPI0009EB14FB|nr:DNA cytosine methyltransferase [Methylobacterium sp. Leaf93]